MFSGTSMSFVLYSIQNKFYGQTILEVPYILYTTLGNPQSPFCGACNTAFSWGFLKAPNALQERKKCLPLFNLVLKPLCSWGNPSSWLPPSFFFFFFLSQNTCYHLIELIVHRIFHRTQFGGYCNSTLFLIMHC